MHLQTLLQDQRATVVDVRSPGEFQTGHVPGSINIPLQEIPEHMAELKGSGKAVVLCCASGNRSGQAERYLRQHGLQDVYNGGAWTDVEYLMERLKP
ncbi:MAG: rhodanese-like domain-containing protein [Flavobacteriales bacterium]|nr:rhodanese-like domain-containing protein [Flavobacteriales bacterium]